MIRSLADWYRWLKLSPPSCWRPSQINLPPAVCGSSEPFAPRWSSTNISSPTRLRSPWAPRYPPDSPASFPYFSSILAVNNTRENRKFELPPYFCTEFRRHARYLPLLYKLLSFRELHIFSSYSPKNTSFPASSLTISYFSTLKQPLYSLPHHYLFIYFFRPQKTAKQRRGQKANFSIWTYWLYYSLFSLSSEQFRSLFFSYIAQKALFTPFSIFHSLHSPNNAPYWARFTTRKTPCFPGKKSPFSTSCRAP